MELINPSFGSPLTGLVMELNHLREKRLEGSTHPLIFFQLKEIFHIMESVGSARLEGNHTTIAEYIESSLNEQNTEDEEIKQIHNIEEALNYIEQHIEDIEINHFFIRELHSLVVKDLSVGNGSEGDRTPGQYRTQQVMISQSDHTPPEPHQVFDLMDDMINFINQDDPAQYDLIKIAMVHHRFTWIHPFTNGNGRTVRLLTYALLAKAGFKIVKGRLINPAAVFFADRDLYIRMLETADNNTETALEKWCEYVLRGLRDEIEKVDRLTDHEYLQEKILLPAIRCVYDRGSINDSEYKALKIAVEKVLIKASDILDATNLARPTVSKMIRELRDKGFLMAEKEGGRHYVIQMQGREIWKCVYIALRNEGFIDE